MTSRTVFHGSGFRVGEFRCRPGEIEWHSENCIGDRAHIVFPGPAVGISQMNRDPLVATPNEVVLYNSGTTYRRRLVSPSGDHSIFVELTPSLADEIGAFEATWAPVGASVDAFHRLLARRDVDDPLQVDELVLRFLRALSPVADTRASRNSAAVVEDVKSVVATRLTERLTLASIGREVHYSPYHLARMFRAVTGQSICTYRTQLRVRHAVERVLDPSVSLAAIAGDLGFASHAHLTTAFHRTLGVRPIDLRRTGRIGRCQVPTT